MSISNEKTSKELGFKRKATFTFQVESLKTVNEIFDSSKKYF